MSSEHVYRHEFALIVRGDGLDFDRISQQLSLPASKTLLKGDLLSKLPRLESPSDMWVHTQPLAVPEGEDPGLNELLSLIEKKKQELDTLSESAQITFRLGIRSMNAQIIFSLMPKTLSRLAAIGYPLEISTFSFGEVGMS